MLMCVEAGHASVCAFGRDLKGGWTDSRMALEGLPSAGTGTQQPWSRELCPAACSCPGRSWALLWWWARELAASAKVNLCWSVMVRLKYSKVVRAVEIKML